MQLIKTNGTYAVLNENLVFVDDTGVSFFNSLQHILVSLKVGTLSFNRITSENWTPGPDDGHLDVLLEFKDMNTLRLAYPEYFI